MHLPTLVIFMVTASLLIVNDSKAINMIIFPASPSEPLKAFNLDQVGSTVL